jgi:hypothetical protein
MKRLPRVDPDLLPDAGATQVIHLIDSSSVVDTFSRRVAEILIYSPGAIPCRCGRYLSEDFDGRMFCRGCEGTDRADITPRLPLCQRPQ